jgi:hypothetical protein
VARQKRAREPTKDEWDDAIDAIKLLDNLDRAEFRKEVEKLARELEREGLAAHRDADRLEGLTRFAHKARDVRPSRYARSAVLARLGRWHASRHPHAAKLQLDRLGETGLHDPGNLRQQAATILDAAEYIDDTLRMHVERSAELKSSGQGPRPSVAMNTVETMMIEWDLGPTETAARLAVEGIHVTAASLKMRLSRRRRREQGQ